VKLALANRATSDPQTDFSWLNYIDSNSVGTGTGKIGTKIAGEHFIIGVDTESSTTGSGATITVAAASGCHTTGSGSNVHASIALNALTKDIAKYAAGTDWPTTYDAETLRVPTSATPGQKYYSCLTFNTPTASYTTIEVEVTRPVLWQHGTGVTTSLTNTQGGTNAGLPAALEWGFTAITATGIAASPHIWDWDAGAVPSQNANQGTELVGAAASVWSTSANSATSRVKVQAQNGRNGDYIAYSLEASSTKKLYAHFWTGQTGMGRGLPAETSSFKHLEVYAFAQPGTDYTESGKAAIPAIVLRVPEAATGGEKYYAGFSVTDDFEANTATYYTSSLEVTVLAGRRYGTAAAWQASLVQPDF
jgi:hypothetical protein